MSDLEAGQAPGVLEPPPGAAYYETLPLAGAKRQHADDGDDDDTTCQLDDALPKSSTVDQQQQVGEEDLEESGDTVDNASNATVPSPVKKTRKRKANVDITKYNTRITNNGLEVEIDDAWYLAIYHNVYVNLVKDQLYTPRYTHGRDSGRVGVNNGEFDKTSYLHAQKDWGKNRDHRPAILFEFKPLDNAHPATDPTNLTCLVNNVRRVIIDVINNKPLRAFAHIPTTVSTKVEGWLMETWFRQDPSLKAEDLIQRMPYTSHDNVYASRKFINRLVRRRELFRDTGKCLSWTKDKHTKKWDVHLINEMGATADPANPNCTRHLEDLNTDENKTFKDETYMTGKFLDKAGDKKLEGERKKEKLQKIEERKIDREARLTQMAPNSSNDGSMQRPAENIKTKSANAETIRNADAQPQQNAPPPVNSYHVGSVPNLNVQSTAYAGLGSGRHGEENRISVPGGYDGSRGPRADSHAVGYPVSRPMDETAPQAQQDSNPMLQQANMFTPAQPSINIGNHQDIARNGHRGLRPFPPQYGQNVQYHLSGVPGQLKKMLVSSVRTPQGLQRFTSNAVGGTNPFNQPHFDPMSQDFGHNFYVNQDLKQPAPIVPYRSQDYEFGVSAPQHPTLNYLEQHQIGQMQPQEPMLTHQQFGRTDHADRDRHAWTGLDFGTHDNNFPHFVSAVPTSIIDHVQQQTRHPSAHGSTVAAANYTSSRKRGADADPDDDDWVGLSSKSRKLN